MRQDLKTQFLFCRECNEESLQLSLEEYNNNNDATQLSIIWIWLSGDCRRRITALRCFAFTFGGLEMISLDQPIYSSLHCQITVILNTFKTKRISPDKVHFKHIKATSVIRTTTRHGVKWCTLMVSDSHFRLCITFYNNLRLCSFVKWPDKNGIFCCVDYQKPEWMFYEFRKHPFLLQ